MKKKIPIALCVIMFLTLLCLSISVFADNDRVRIHLKDGTVIEGELITSNDQTYRVKVGEEIKEIPWDQIDKIDVMPERKLPPVPTPITPTMPISPTQRSGMTIPTIIDNIGQRLMTYPHKEFLLTWIIDDSPSMQDERESIRDEIDNFIFMIKDKKILNMAVVGFGEKSIMHCGLSRDSEKIKKAVMDVGTIGSGTENCMAAIDYSLKIFKTSSLKKIFIIVTDESGDDNHRLESTIKELKKYDVMVYVLGRESSFLRPHIDELQKDNKTVIEINNGLASITHEIISEAFYPLNGILLGIKDRLKSGFPPYTLARLCEQAKGHYYFLREPAYDSKKMKAYEPDLCSSEEYRTRNHKDPLRSIVTNIRQSFDDPNINSWYDMRIVFCSPAEAKLRLQIATDILPKTEGLIQQLETALSKTQSDKISKRWQANAELVLAQLYCIAHFLNQYILAVQDWVKSDDFFKPPLNNEFYCLVEKDDAPIRNGPRKDYRALALQAIEKVITNHPGTPWSVVAQTFKEEGLKGCKIERRKDTKYPEVDRKKY